MKIGAFCSIAAGAVAVIGGDHRVDWVTTYPFNVLWPGEAAQIEGHPKSRGDITIGNDVWVGADAMIMSGVTIGDGAVVGARSVVTRDVPPYAIVVGAPAKIVRFRFDSETIKSLLQVRWWDWEDEQIAEAVPLLMAQDVPAFLAAAERHEHGTVE